MTKLARRANGYTEKTKMIKLIAVAFALVAATSAHAMSPAPLHQPNGMITQVREGCGVGRVRINGICVARTTRRHVRREARRDRPSSPQVCAMVWRRLRSVPLRRHPGIICRKNVRRDNRTIKWGDPPGRPFERSSTCPRGALPAHLYVGEERARSAVQRRNAELRVHGVHLAGA